MGSRVKNNKKIKAKNRKAATILAIALTMLYLITTSIFIAIFNVCPI